MNARPLPAEILADPFDAVRRSCAEVARRARSVRIDAAGLDHFSEALPVEELAAASGATGPRPYDPPETRAAFAICLNAINFGSGWFPRLTKLAGKSGYRTIEAHLRRLFTAHGRPSAEWLVRSEADSMTALLGQQGAPPEVGELMELFARAWRDLGELLLERFEGSFMALVEAARGSAAGLVRVLLKMPLFHDVLVYDELQVAFLKRAQLTAADLAAALPDGAGKFADLDRLTIFADNLVPHVLRLDGVLCFDAALVERIEREELLVAGSPEEVEIRACAVAAVEQLRARLGDRGHHVRCADIDFWLWARGGGASYKARPRHRARCTHY